MLLHAGLVSQNELHTTFGAANRSGKCVQNKFADMMWEDAFMLMCTLQHIL